MHHNSCNRCGTYITAEMLSGCWYCHGPITSWAAASPTTITEPVQPREAAEA